MIEPSKGMDTLGVLLAPTGSMEDEFKYLYKKASSWAQQIAQSKLSGGEAWQGMTSTIMRTLQYPLGATTFTQEECNRLIRPIISEVLPRAKACRNFPLDLRHGNSNTLGLGIDDLCVTQGCEKLAFSRGEEWI